MRDLPPPAPDEMPSRVGRFMLLAAWGIGLTLLALLFDGLFERQANPNPDPRAVVGAAGVPEVVLERNRAGHYVANGRIDGLPVRFMVDTGATRVALPLALAERLNLALRPGGPVQTANGTAQSWNARLERVELGGLVEHGVPATVLPNMPGDEVLLGMSYLKRLELIQRGNTLTLRQHR